MIFILKIIDQYQYDIDGLESSK